MKTCGNCKLVLPEEQFSWNKGKRRSTCKSCHSIPAWKSSLKIKYGITPEQYETMLVSQGNKCAICRALEPGGYGNRFHVDHDHVTGKVRSLLCSLCNLQYTHHLVTYFPEFVTYYKEHDGTHDLDGVPASRQSPTQAGT